MHALSLFSVLTLPVALTNGLTIKVIETDVIVPPMGKKASTVDATAKHKYSMLGCYSDQSSPRGLDKSFWQDGAMTVKECASFCNHYTYFGVEDGNQCFCGFQINDPSIEVTDTQCNMPCAGDSEEFCGGFWRLNIYQYDTSHHRDQGKDQGKDGLYFQHDA